MNTFIGPIFAFLGALVGGILTFIVTIIQINNNKKNMKSQIDSELDKVKLQYNLEQRRDDRNFLYRLKLEKSSQLADELVDYIRQIMKSFYMVQDYKQNNDSFSELNDEERLDKLRKLEDENQELIRSISKQLSVLVRYLPENKNGFNNVTKKYSDLANYIYDNYTYPKNNITDEQKKINGLTELYVILSHEFNIFQEQVSKNMETILIDLERKDL